MCTPSLFPPAKGVYDIAYEADQIAMKVAVLVLPRSPSHFVSQPMDQHLCIAQVLDRRFAAPDELVHFVASSMDRDAGREQEYPQPQEKTAPGIAARHTTIQ